MKAEEEALDADQLIDVRIRERGGRHPLNWDAPSGKRMIIYPLHYNIIANTYSRFTLDQTLC